MNDEKKIHAIRNRNEFVMGGVMDTYAKLLWSIASRVLNNIGTVEDIEECVADTFIYLWEHPDKFDPRRGRLKTWLSVIARTQAINRCREIVKRNTVSLEETTLIEQMGVVDTILQAESRKILAAAIDSLDEKEREILLRRYYYDQKPREIAFALSMSVKQVDNRLYQTKRKLREMLTRQGDLYGFL